MTQSDSTALFEMQSLIQRIQYAVYSPVWFFFIFTFLPGIDRAEQTAPLSTVLLIEHSGSATDSDRLFKAVQAQLSGAPLTLKRIRVDPDQNPFATHEETALRAATEHRADIVFWLEKKEQYQVYFYIPKPDGKGLVFTRTLNPEGTTETGLYDVIAIAAAGMVEGLLITHRIVPEQKAEPVRQPIFTVEKKTPNQRRKRIELFASYTGTYFARGMLTHGATLGLGFIPMDHAVIAASFTQSVPMHHQTGDLTLDINSRAVSVSAAGRLVYGAIELNLGLTWTIDLRSFSVASESSTIKAEPDGFKDVHSLSPFISVAWIFNDRVGLFGKVGANLALNETTYKVTRNDENVPVVDPFFAKLAWQFGLTIRI